MPRSPAKPKPAPPTLVFLVRHGQTPTTGAKLPGRAKGLHLADTGQAQAQAAADRIGALHAAATERAAKATKAKPATGPGLVAAVYASPMERTRETAAPIGKAVGQRVQVARGLNECDFGEWTGGELKELSKLPEWRTVQRYPSGFRFPGGESFAEMQTRITGTLQDLVHRHAGETIVAVSHADPIKAAVAHALGTHLDLFQRIVVSPCSITAILYGDSGPIVLAVNSTGQDLSTLVPS
jgi:probable phosphoglycerate mutase